MAGNHKKRAVYVEALIRSHVDKGWSNLTEFARFLSSVDDKEIAAESWRKNVRTWLERNQMKLPKPSDFKDIEEDWLMTEPYYHDKHNDRYITSLNSGLVVVSQSRSSQQSTGEEN